MTFFHAPLASKYGLTSFIFVRTCLPTSFCASARDLEVFYCIQRKIVESSEFPSRLKSIDNGLLLITTLPFFVTTISPSTSTSNIDHRAQIVLRFYDFQEINEIPINISFIEVNVVYHCLIGTYEFSCPKIHRSCEMDFPEQHIECIIVKSMCNLVISLFRHPMVNILEMCLLLV